MHAEPPRLVGKTIIFSENEVPLLATQDQQL